MVAAVGTTNTDAQGNSYRVVLADDFSNGYLTSNWGYAFGGGTYWNGAFDWSANDVNVRNGEMQVTDTRHADGSWTAGGFSSFKADKTITYGTVEFDARVEQRPGHPGRHPDVAGLRPVARATARSTSWKCPRARPCTACTGKAATARTSIARSSARSTRARRTTTPWCGCRTPSRSRSTARSWRNGPIRPPSRTRPWASAPWAMSAPAARHGWAAAPTARRRASSPPTSTMW